MTPDPFREALHALLSADRKLQMTLDGTLGSVGRNNAWDAMLAAFAEVERLYAARVGEEYEVTMVVNPEYPADRHYWDNGNIPTFPANYRLTPGVFRVTKGEAGVRSDCPIVGCTIAGPHDHHPYRAVGSKGVRMTLTKADIDALVDGLNERGWDVNGSEQLRQDAYLAAGLTASGERKPERVRCWLWSYLDGAPFHMAFSDPTGIVRVEEGERLTPGWFVPDGAA